ncbi:HAD family hydrolase, partial [Acidobacteriota bacterium]
VEQIQYIIGLDLHGTLLDDQWEVKPPLIQPLAEALESVRQFCGVHVCSGNDLTFIPDYIPDELRLHFDGYVLETGCVVSDGQEEKIIVTDDLVLAIKDLEKQLKEKKFPWVRYFARRLTSISMFSRTEEGGTDPAEYFPEVQAVVKQLGFTDEVRVTHSNVAVDIIPQGYDKFRGLEYIAQGRPTIGIADSLNDRELVRDASIAFVPANASMVLLRELEQKGKRIVDVGDPLSGQGDVVWRSRYSTTEGVLDILRFISKTLGGMEVT